MDDYQAIRLMQNSVGGIIDTVEKRKGDEILMGLKSGTIDPDSLGNRPYERQAVDSWRTADTENYMKKYSGMSHDQIQDIDPSQEDNPMHATIAYSKVMGSLAENEQVKMATMAARTQRGMEEYKLFDAKRNQVNRYIANGENDMAGNMVSDMLSNSFYPGQAKYDPSKGTVKVYRKIISADDMGSPLQLENEIPISEIGKTLNDIDGKKYATAKAIMTDVAAKANRDSLANPKQYVNPETGKSIFASSLVNLNNLSESYFVSHDSKGKQIQIKDIGALMGMGYMPLEQAGEYAKMQKTGAETSKALAGIEESTAKANKATAEAGLAGAKQRAVDEGRPYGSKAAGKKVTEKSMLDELKVAAKNVAGLDSEIWTKADVAKDAEAEAKELEKAKEKAPVGTEFDEGAWKTKRNIRVYGVADPLSKKDPNIKHIIDDETGLRMLKFPTGKAVILHVGEPGQAGAKQKPEQKKAGLSAPASSKGQPFNPPKIKY